MSRIDSKWRIWSPEVRAESGRTVAVDLLAHHQVRYSPLGIEVRVDAVFGSASAKHYEKRIVK